ncbi:MULTISPECIES: polysialyltransferase family glycosyltransferase [unclassified Streptomyces]|uniref:polysialyltransferase family glycosyltransferase n=1 Tax=unclassified Streptomyces TaxID=2593676 RepID=UPI000CD5BA74|nr:polysialyltransferase family glycosyltransferase [Streptomyces sp. SM10]
MTTQILAASGLRGTAVLAAAVDSGCFGEADRRVLLLCDTAAVPEAVAPLDTVPGFDRLRARFDEVLSWNDAVFPLHPAAWTPRPDDVPLWERHLRRAWGLGDEEVELALESPLSGPSQALAQIFMGGPLTVYADGLTGYGPTPGKIPPLIGTRVRQLLHPDLLPGLQPLLLGEFDAAPRPLPTAALRKVFGELAYATPDFGAPEGSVVLVLTEKGVLPAAEETELRLRTVRATAALGHTHLVLVPHPRGSSLCAPAVRSEAARLGVGVTAPDPGPGVPVPAEVLFERLRPALVVGCSSTALLTAAAHYGLPVARTGTGALLERLTPYENPARIPATIVDALLPDLAGPDAVRDGAPLTGDGVAKALDGLLPAVAFAMQPRVRPDLRPAAERYLSTRLNARTWRYFKRRRLGSLALPGVVPARLAFVRRNATLRRLARRARALRRR